MKIIETVDEFRQEWANLKELESLSLGLVPTMGFLHEGHISLVKKSVSQNDVTAATIFVNPTQFGENEDFEDYPRDMKSDLDFLDCEGVDIVFVPSLEEMYPEGFETSINVGSIATRLEGKYRPGHFSGVATVVCKLLSICRPDRAYFGQKDAQQCAVIMALNRDLCLGSEIVVGETIRSSDGLALSSRNSYLSDSEREKALSLSSGLFAARKLWRSGENASDRLRSVVLNEILSGNSEVPVEIDYVSVADKNTFMEIDRIEEAGNAIILVAAKIGTTRLIDNVALV